MEDPPMNRCVQCGEPMRAAVRLDVAYEDIGGSLPDVSIEGVEVARCPSCDDVTYAIPRIAELHRALTAAVVAKRSRLSGAEIRYLRKTIGWSARDLARMFSVARET